MTTRTRNMLAGQRRTFSWPVTVESGSVASLNAVGLLTRVDTDTTTELAATPTASADPLVGTIAVVVELADTTPTGTFVLRLDVDDAAGDLDADQFTIFVTAASAQRP